MISAFCRFHIFWIVCGLLALSLRPSLAEENNSPKRLPDAVEKSLGEVVKKAVEMKSAMLMEDMTKIIAMIVDATKIGDATRKQFEPEARTAVESSMVPWKKDLEAVLRSNLSEEIKSSLEVLSQWSAEVVVNNGFVSEPAKPAEQLAWKNSLKKILSAEQLAMLETRMKERDVVIGKEIQEYLKPHLAEKRKELEFKINSEANDIIKFAESKGDRAKKVTEEALEVAKHIAMTIETRWAGEMRGMSDDARETFTMNGERAPFMDENVDVPPETEAWENAIQRDFLTTGEQKRWTSALTFRRERQGKALAMQLISEIDSKVFLTAAQRAKLEPLVVKIVMPTTKYEMDNFSIKTNDLSKLNLDELKLIIDDKQLQHLKEQAENGNAEVPIVSGQGKKKSAESFGNGDLDVEAILSIYFHDHDMALHDRLAKGMIVKLESIHRVVKLSDDGFQRLEIATRGAAEHALDVWRQNSEQWVRNGIKNVSAKTLKQRLEIFNTIDGSFDNRESLFDQPIWTNTVTDVLSESQMELLADDASGRKNYHDRARILIILEELNSTYHLSLEQLDKLEPLLSRVVAEYASDILTMIGSDSDATRQMSVLLAGVPEDKTRSILTPEQFDHWKKTEKDLWINAKRNHDQRKKSNASRNANRSE